MKIVHMSPVHMRVVNVLPVTTNFDQRGCFPSATCIHNMLHLSKSWKLIFTQHSMITLQYHVLFAFRLLIQTHFTPPDENTTL